LVFCFKKGSRKAAEKRQGLQRVFPNKSLRALQTLQLGEKFIFGSGVLKTST
jgi:hypothetical protein